VNSTFAVIANGSDLGCEAVPLPHVAEVTLPGLPFASAMNAATVGALILFGLTINAFGTGAVTMIGANLFAS